MNKNERVLLLVKDWVKKIGPRAAAKRLVARDFATTTAQKIAYGTYISTPSPDNAWKLLEEMAKDGIAFDDGIAS